MESFIEGLIWQQHKANPYMLVRQERSLELSIILHEENYVVIQHEDGTTALYAHQQEYQVYVGDQVEQGQIIGMWDQLEIVQVVIYTLSFV